ncbi:hypothetical protein BDV19DRAFT_362117 [Aspergillus venezuelensis]
MTWKSSWENQLVPLFGVYLFCCFGTPVDMIMSLVTSNTAGHTKKAAVAGMQWAAYCLGNGIAPRLVLAQEKREALSNDLHYDHCLHFCYGYYFDGFAVLSHVGEL